MRNISQLSSYIRYQLAQLSAQNKHHEFEHLSRHFARLRICQHILPATGPVSARGHQGRDFETYRSYLAATPLAASTFLGSAANKTLVFACSLQADIYPKIRSDVATICAAPTEIDDIYFFAESDIPVARRHALQKWANEKHGVRLEILDGAALAEGLAHPDVFWIAEQYLAVSAEHYPQVEDDDTLYTEYKTRWFGQKVAPTNFADFFEIKYGLRRATFSKPHKPDLATWIRTIGSFLTDAVPSSLRRRAIYEICVAALRGQNNLDPHSALITEYFANLDGLNLEELRDATTTG